MKQRGEFKKAKKASALAAMDGGEQKIVHVGYFGSALAVVVASSPEEVNLEASVTLDEVLKFNPQGWVLDDNAIRAAELNFSQK
ncbi:MAG: hypothetical protein ACFB2W_00535 [Leptolyngbyaceae cyanobacterium]